MPLQLSLNRFILAALVSSIPYLSAIGQAAVTVNVDPGKSLNILTNQLVGAWTNIGDGDLTDPKGMAMMKAAGITSITYPTGWDDIADIYHWSTNSLTPNAGTPDAVRKPSVQGKNDFASVARALGSVGINLVVHVNYGSNMDGSGGGEPKEAAAWVAYANGSPTDTKEIGKDSKGTDWKTVGYWAGMRASQPVNTDDGYNFLRVNHPESFHVTLWQVGENISENGFYGSDHAGSLDLHAPYPASQKDNGKRKKLPQLSPRAYGEQFSAYAAAMKAVDPTIQVGATLTVPMSTIDDTTKRYASDWNDTVLKTACKDIDYVSFAYHPGGSSNDEQWKYLDDPSLLDSTTDLLPQVLKELIYEDKTNCPGGKIPHVALSQFSNPNSWPTVERPIVLALFESDMFAALAEAGISNANWFQLRDGGMFADGKPTAQYYGSQMTHIVALRPGDQYIAATSPRGLSVHATKRQDGYLGVLLINKDRHDAKTVKVNIVGSPNLASTAVRFDYSPAQQAAGTGPVKSAATIDGSSVTVTVPAYGIVDLLLPPKK